MKIREFLSACYKFKEKIRVRTTIFFYYPYLKLLIRIISRRRPVRVLFYVNNLSMWKSDKLIMLLKDDSRFEPMVASMLYTKDSVARRQELDKEISSHFSSMGISYSCGFDFSKDRLFPVSRFKADIIFYPQPYYNKLKEVSCKSLLSYIPYCFEMEKTTQAINSLYQNICWKYFVSTQFNKEAKSKSNYNHGVNLIVAGNPIADYFLDGHTPKCNIWPIDNPDLKRIIWAPHHSILPDDWLDYSNFLDIADQMLDLAKRYSDRIQIVFKPHPMLKEKLYRLESWGPEKTDRYYNTWRTMPNCSFADGSFVDLFMTSDAMIHDCSSFTVEYLYVNKPVLFLTRKESIGSFNEFADSCFRVHYHGASIQDIESFIDNIINGVDPLLDKRTRFISDTLMPSGKSSTAENIYMELCKIFDYHEHEQS